MPAISWLRTKYYLKRYLHNENIRSYTIHIEQPRPVYDSGRGCWHRYRYPSDNSYHGNVGVEVRSMNEIIQAFYLTWPLWAFLAVLAVSLFVEEGILAHRNKMVDN